MKSFIILFSAILMLATGCCREEVNPCDETIYSSADGSCLRTAPSSAVNAQVIKLKGVYTPFQHADSLTLAPGGIGVTGQYMTCQVVTSTSGRTYQLTGMSAQCNFSIKMKDANGGQIVAGDNIGIMSCGYTINNTTYNLRTTGTPVITLSGDTVRVNYGDCILPLNGSSGSVEMIFVQVN